jgi:hypothetical protein
MNWLHKAIHKFAHAMGWNSVRLVNEVGPHGEEYLATECITCGKRTLLQIVTTTFVTITAFVAITVLACTPSPVSPPPATLPSTVYGELVEAGCLATSPDGIDSIAEEHADPEQPDWFACLFDGGTVQSCGVPCSSN